jgi:hypothetical protein
MKIQLIIAYALLTYISFSISGMADGSDDSFKCKDYTTTNKIIYRKYDKR